MSDTATDQLAAKCHRDGRVTYWSVYEQRWLGPTLHVPDREYAGMPNEGRERVLAHVRSTRAGREALGGE